MSGRLCDVKDAGCVCGLACVACGHRQRQSVTARHAAKSLQLCLTLCNPIDGSPPGSSVHGVFQPACVSSSPAFLMIYSAYKLNKQGDNIQP